MLKLIPLILLIFLVIPNNCSRRHRGTYQSRSRSKRSYKSKSSTSSDSVNSNSDSDSSDNSDSDGNGNENVGEFSYLFTQDEYETIKSKRIRREVRDLSSEQWLRVVDAMQVMKTLSNEDGILMYGDKFRNYDTLVCQHSRATGHTLGDLAHLGPHFPIWHRAFVLAFENSLLSIDNKIDGAPYWDLRRDIIENDHDLSNSIIFSDQYFGNYTGNRDENYVITNGQFAYWKINDNPDEVGCPEFFQNGYGLLRQKNNFDNTPYVTRIGGNVCGSQEFPVGVLETYYECLYNVTDYTDFFWCFNLDVHARAHFGVGGTRSSYDTQIDIDWDGCVSWHAAGTIINGVRKLAMRYNCFECPTAGDCDDTSEDPYLSGCALCTPVNDDNTCTIGENNNTVAYTIINDLEDQHIIGDFYDLSTSVNDPIFMFHHSNIDRYLFEWELRNYNDAPYYNYPETGYEMGINLDDTISDEYGFENLFYDDVQDTIGDGPYSFRDIWDGTTFVDSVYTFDTIIDLIKKCDYSDDSNDRSRSDDSSSS